MSDFLDYTRSKSRELASALERVCASPLSFETDYPMVHSSANHVHLWFLEQQANHAAWIDTKYRTEFIKHILEHWRIRLKGMAPYRGRGYRVIVYEDASPTLSVVAETYIGFPYRFGKPVQVDRIEAIAELYADRSWRERFEFEPWEISEERIIQSVATNHGSTSKPTAQKLGLQVGKLRLLIIQMDLGEEMKQLHKKSNDGRWIFPISQRETKYGTTSNGCSLPATTDFPAHQTNLAAYLLNR